MWPATASIMGREVAGHCNGAIHSSCVSTWTTNCLLQILHGARKQLVREMNAARRLVLFLSRTFLHVYHPLAVRRLIQTLISAASRNVNEK